MAGCHHDHGSFDGASTAYRRVLFAVIAINATMFVVELVAGISAGSMALQADALDFLGDSLTYALSLAVIGRALAVRARAALFKGVSLGLLGCWVLGSTLYRVFILETPDALSMGTIGTLAFVANVASALLLLRFRNGDANVRSVWLCSRNDAIGNVAVVIAATGVFAAGSAWPDLIVAAVMASLFLWSAVRIIGQAMDEIAQARTTAPAE
ncbi:cation transporter [Oceanibacterium hippocampi]|uniref:Zinc transporter ZitB n=1 Tax=Oceanibacterium hippocampi TaxID=745714 RepID=A0A1Y5SWD6_9PROT|nr:cation transporter [Oceanibacterium hippocampi]SLN49290.1 zinc transporter ZitB [Oceanibacterium hippocampi]